MWQEGILFTGVYLVRLKSYKPIGRMDQKQIRLQPDRDACSTMLQ